MSQVYSKLEELLTKANSKLKQCQELLENINDSRFGLPQPLCPVCDWSFPKNFTEQEKTHHVERCLEEESLALPAKRYLSPKPHKAKKRIKATKTT